MRKRNNKKLRARLKLWLDSEQSGSSFGDGKWHLLQTIEKTESLRSTCELLGISYRKAWGDLKKAEQCLDLNLVTRSRGGRAGGQTVLSEQGKKWIKAYESFHRDIEGAVKTAYAKHIKGLVK